MLKSSTLFSRGLSRTRHQLRETLGGWFSKPTHQARSWEELEEMLLSADLSFPAVQQIRSALQQQARSGSLSETSLKAILHEMLAPLEAPLQIAPGSPFVILVVGVNGAGKTTSIAKLAHYFRSQGKSVLLAGADTFRAAAASQLQIWSERNEVRLISNGGGNPTAVVFDAYDAAVADRSDVLLVDTAGRLANHKGLMEELAKMRRTLQRKNPQAPGEILLVLDGSSGRNIASQVSLFKEQPGITGLLMTKLDGTAKGGALVELALAKPPVPVRFLGFGESLEDLAPFDRRQFVDALINFQDAASG